MKWKQLEVTGEIPSQRGQHTVTSVPGKIDILLDKEFTLFLRHQMIYDYILKEENKVYLFGGFNGRDFFNDLCVLDTQTLVWSKAKVGGDVPKERSGIQMEIL